MKRLLVCLSLVVLLTSSDKSPQEKYVAKYAATAVREMYRSGVPASITLAQGLLESRYGLSELAARGNNHFGIKCHDWKGKSMKVDDDRRGECFRVYDTADESFRDHSDFLRYRDRYKFLFELEVTDYKGWSYGLKKAGYATDPQYADKLIKLIEDYGLAAYDKMTVVSVAQAVTVEEEEAAPAPAAGKKVKKTKKVKVKRVSPSEPVPEAIPASPLSIEEPKRLEATTMEEFHFPLSRQMYSRNGVPFLYSVEGESYASIAEANHLFLKELLAFNDLSEAETLLPGTIVYLQAKKKNAAPGLDKFIVDETPVSLRDICQRFGVKMSAVRKLNGFASGYEPREGDTIYLRKKKS